MTKKLRFSVLVLFVLIMFAGISAIGQTVNMNRYIELTVTPGKWIKMNFSGDSMDTDIMVVSGTRDTLLTINTNWTEFNYFYSETTTMRVYGNVKQYQVFENLENLTGLDASHNQGLEYIDCYDNKISNINVNGLTNLHIFSCAYNSLTNIDISGLDSLVYLLCQGNKLTSLDIRGLPKLKYITCFGNQISTCGLDSIFHQLTPRDTNDKGMIHIKSSFHILETNPGTETCRDTIATNKNWRVIDYLGDMDHLSDIINTNYACPYFTLGIEEIKAEDIAAKVYPNPVSNAFNIETMEKVEDIILYDVLGKEVLRTKKTNDIDVSNLNNGIYILKLITEKGIGEYKLVKE